MSFIKKGSPSTLIGRRIYTMFLTKTKLRRICQAKRSSSSAEEKESGCWWSREERFRTAASRTINTMLTTKERLDEEEGCERA